MTIRGLGTDIVEISRISAQVKKNYDHLAKNILTDIELTQFYNSNFPDRYLAKRFAAKEAAAKALGTGISQGVNFLNFCIINDHFGKPILTLSGKAKEISLEKGIPSFHLSISDEKKYAVATVIFES